MSLRKLIALSLALFFLGSGLAACNMIEGVGQDITAVARSAKDSMFGRN